MDLSEITRIAKALIPTLQALYVFGSIAAETENTESDLDLAFLAESSLAPFEQLEIASQISLSAGREVDLIDLRNASTVLKVEVLDKGKLLFAESTELVQYFEMYAFSDYCRLNQERADILYDFYKGTNS